MVPLVGGEWTEVRTLAIGTIEQRTNREGEAERMGAEVGGIRLIAAHAWDVGGVLDAGYDAAFVARPGMALDPLFSAPDVVGNDLVDVAGKILQRQGISTA